MQKFVCKYSNLNFKFHFYKVFSIQLQYFIDFNLFFIQTKLQLMDKRVQSSVVVHIGKELFLAANGC